MYTFLDNQYGMSNHLGITPFGTDPLIFNAFGLKVSPLLWSQQLMYRPARGGGYAKGHL